MASVWPAKNNYATGDVLTAANMNGIGDDLNDVYAYSYTNNYFGGKNRIINGAMEIDQRNNGASVSATAGGQYFLDRWNVLISAASKFTVQQNAGSVTTLAQFPKYLGVTSSTAWTVGVNDYATLNQMIEGYNVADFGLGTSSPKTFTVSFWVRSSLTGTFGGVISNAITSASATRSYPFTYTISAANTWEQKTVTLTGETTAIDWANTNGKGLTIQFSLAAGTNKLTTANSWASGEYFGATGQTNILATNGATWYVTGVQVELGSVATPFRRAAGNFQGELAACQRYYEVFGEGSSGRILNSTTVEHYLRYVQKRVAPSFSLTTTAPQVYDPATGTKTASASSASNVINSSVTGGVISTSGWSSLTAGNWAIFNGDYIQASAEL